jgi:hypothetical protein
MGGGYAVDAGFVAQYNIEPTSEIWDVAGFYSIRRMYMSSISKVENRKPLDMAQTEWNKMSKWLEKQFKRTEKMLSEMFIKAVIEHDGHRCRR